MKTIKAACSSFEIELGQIDKNYEKILDTIKKASDKNAKIINFPELSLTGSTLNDLFFQKKILDSSIEYLLKLEKESENLDILFTVGIPLEVKNKLYNSIFVIKSGLILGCYLKENLKKSERKIFSEFENDFSYINLKNYGFPVLNNSLISSKDLNIAVSIGEDEDKSIPKSLFYKELGANLILHPENMYQFALSEKEKIDKYKFLSKDTIYISTSSGIGESSTDFVFSGLDIILYDGKIIDKKNDSFICEIIDYKEAINLLDYDSIEIEFKNCNYDYKLNPYPYLPNSNEKDVFCKDVLEIQAKGLIRRMKHIGIKDVVLGLSGGLDSTMAILAIVKAYEIMGIDKSHIHAYSLPAFATSNKTKSNAKKLSEALEIELTEIDLTESLKAHLKDISHSIDLKDTAYENSQARERTQVLMDIANMKNAIVIGTGDLSELALGFATYNGDQMSMYGVNASITKTEIRYILNWILEKTSNKNLKDALKSILDTPISPELVNDDDNAISQKTEEIVGPYELIDYFIYEFFENNCSKEEISKRAFIAFDGKYSEDTINKWLTSFIKRLFNNQFKRSCMPDGVAVSNISFSPRNGILMPSDIKSDFFN